MRTRWTNSALRPAGLRLAIGLTLVFLAGACSTAPYVDGRREAGKRITVGPSNADVVAVCYGGDSGPSAEALKLAESECAKTDRVPKLESRTQFACALFAPTRAYFRCVAPS